MASTAGGPELVGELAAQMAALWRADAVGVVHGRGDVVVDANDEFVRFTGRSADRVRGAAWQDLVPPERVDRDTVAFQEFLVQDSGSFLTELLTPDDTRVPVLVAATLVSRETYDWVAVAVDLSADERLRRLAFNEAAIVFTLLADAPVGFAFISPDMRFLRVNDELAAMNGFTVAEHEGTPVFDLLPQFKNTVEPLLRQVLETGEPLRDVEVVGQTEADPGVEHIWTEHFFPVRAPDGPVVGVAALARDETEMRRLQRELAEVAEQRRRALEELQATLLPERLPSVEGCTVTARYMPAAAELRLGGDWYDAEVGRDGRLLVSVGDAVGHGVPAIGLMAQAASALHAYACQGLCPEEVLRQVDLLLHHRERESVASAVVARVDPVSGAVEYATAGHPYALLRDGAGRVRRLDTAQGPLLGARTDARFRTATAELEPGGALLLYTDGLVERRHENLAVGIDRLAAAVAAHPPGAGAERLVEDVVEACLGGRHREDDVCVLALVRDPA
jgi:PAS domain S-box-containing protein